MTCRVVLCRVVSCVGNGLFIDDIHRRFTLQPSTVDFSVKALSESEAAFLLRCGVNLRFVYGVRCCPVVLLAFHIKKLAQPRYKKTKILSREATGSQGGNPHTGISTVTITQ